MLLGNIGMQIMRFHIQMFKYLQHHMTSLIWAAGRNHVAIVQALIKAGANVNTADKVWYR